MGDDRLIWADAREALPLPDLMRALGDAEFVPDSAGGPNKEPDCPFCGARKGKWWLRLHNGRYQFGCWNKGKAGAAPCRVSGRHEYGGEIGYLMLRKGMTAKEAAKEFLRMALPDRVAPEKPQPAEPAPFVHPSLSVETKTPWHSLWKKLAWSTADGERESKKRGLSAETLALMGVRSNTRANAPLVESLSTEFLEQDLIDLGILKLDEVKEGNLRPAGQLVGYGRTGEFDCACGARFRGRLCPKCRKKADDKKAVWSQKMEPPLIPYFDTRGAVEYLRPHKGGIANRLRKFLESIELPDDDDDEECASCVYVPPNFAELLEACNGRCVLTEGEWKVGALMQTEIAALGCPGITFIRNAAFREKLVGILRYYDVREVVVIFDNEVKNDPSFPDRYQPNAQKQHDTQIWAEYTVLDLWGVMHAKRGTIRVGRLPDSERVEGKADFDSILGACVRRDGLKAGTVAARRIFRDAIAAAVEDPGKQKDLFPGSVRRIIDRRLHLLRGCKRRLLFGGDAERELASRFAEFDRTNIFAIDEAGDKGHVIDRMMCDAFKAVAGCYYVRKKLTKEKLAQIDDVLLPAVRGLITVARGDKNYANQELLYAYERALRERKKGRPVPISTCRIKGEFMLRKPGGEAVRKVRIYNQRDTRHQDRPALVELNAEDLSQPSKFRERLAKYACGGWSKGQEELDFLREDLDDEVYLKDIIAITHCGFHESGLWFYGDGAFLDDRKTGRSLVLRPDENGIIWNPLDGLGYLLEGESAGENFALGLPNLFTPQRGEDDVTADALFLAGGIGDALATYVAKYFHAPETKPVRDLMLSMQSGDTKPCIEDLLAMAGSEKIRVPDFAQLDAATGEFVLVEESVHDALESALVRAIFLQMKADLRATIGDMDAWMALSVLFSYAAGPALVTNWYCHPGLFATGDFGSGKSETLRRLNRMWGMKENQKVDLSETTAVALNRTLTQYSSVPPFFDEYRKGDAKEKKWDNTLRAATERGASHKGNITSKTSTSSLPPRTSPLVAGQNSPGDSATASRYVHIQFSQQRRAPGSEGAWDRIKASAPHYYHLGRWLMSRRMAFENRLLQSVRLWMKDDSIKDSIAPTGAQGRDRVILTTGVAFSGFCAFAEMIGCALQPEERTAFREFAIKHGGRTLTEVSDETFRNRFWKGIITGLNRPSSGIKPKFFGIRYVTIGTPETKPAASAMYFSTKHIRQAMLGNRPCKLWITNTKDHPNSVPVLFLAAAELYEEWQRDLRGFNQDAPISLQNLRAEMEREPYFIPAPKLNPRKSIMHQVRLRDDTDDSASKRWPCWAISLETPRDEKGQSTEHVFEFARDILMALDRLDVLEDEDPAAAAE